MKFLEEGSGTILLVHCSSWFITCLQLLVEWQMLSSQPLSSTLITFVQFFTWLLCSTMILLQTITPILLLLGKFTVSHFSNHLNKIKLVILHRCFVCRNFVCLAVFLNSCPIPILDFLRLRLALYCFIYVYLAAHPDRRPTPMLQLLHLRLTLHCSIYVHRRCRPSTCVLLLLALSSFLA